MRKALAGLVAVLSLSLVTSQVSVAAITPGTKCSKSGATSTFNGKKYTCVKSGKKLVWNKGVTITKPKPVVTPTTDATPVPTTAPTPSPTPTPTATIRDWVNPRSTDEGYLNEYNGACQKEFDLPSYWSALQDAYMDFSRCSGIYRIAKYELGSQRPKAQLSSSSNDLNTRECQISVPSNVTGLKGFFHLFDSNKKNFANSVKFPGPKMTIQIIPIYAVDTEAPKNSPEKDYGAYTDFVTDWAKYSSDGESAIDVRYPNSYLEFPNKVSSYGIYHENRHDSPSHKQFVKDLVATVDPKIDFTGVDVIIVVVPPGTPLWVLEQGTLKNFETKEGLVRIGTTEYPYTLKDMSKVKFANLTVPFWWIHELYHSGIGFDDHYGDSRNNVNSEYGLGWWTMMTPWGGDLSAWQKWIVGFVTDSQVHCIKPTTASTHWIVPSSVKTKEKKLVVIPLSQSKGIVIESIRAAGLYYKIPKASEGVLVYEVDLTIEGHGLGYKLVLPTNRNPDQPPFFLSQATLRQGESVFSNGYKISIVESGSFGDVVKVEKP